QAVEIAFAGGAVISFDAGLHIARQHASRPRVEALMEKAHLLKMNEPEVYFWADADREQPIEQAAQTVFQRYRPLALLLTRSANGSSIVMKDAVIHCRALTVD